MLLLTVNEWIGPSRHCPSDKQIDVSESLVAFGTHRPLGVALVLLKAYSDAYKAKYASRMSVEFRLISVSHIDDLRPEEMEAAGVDLIEDLEDRLQD